MLAAESSILTTWVRRAWRALVRALRNRNLIRQPARRGTSTSDAIENNQESQRKDVRDSHHIKPCVKRAGPVSKNSQHLRSEVSEQTCAEADHAHCMSRFTARCHAAGESVQLIGRREAETDHCRSGNA